MAESQRIFLFVIQSILKKSPGLIVSLVFVFSSWSTQAQSVEEFFDHQVPEDVRDRPEPELKRIGKKRKKQSCDVYELNLPYWSQAEESFRWSQLLYFVPRTAETVPFVVVLPNAKGRTIAENRLAENLCLSKIGAAVPRYDRAFPKNFEDVSRQGQEEVLMNRTLVDFLEKQSQFASDQISLFGISYGGIVSTYLTAVEPRFNRTLILAGGADIAQIMTVSKNSDSRKFKKKMMKKHNLKSSQEFYERLSEAIYIKTTDESLNLSSFRDRIFQIIIKKDGLVPTANQEQLWELYGQPEFRYYRARGAIGGLPLDPHVKGILSYVSRESREYVSFFKN